jgi:hypothetical protein
MEAVEPVEAVAAVEPVEPMEAVAAVAVRVYETLRTSALCEWSCWRIHLVWIRQ